MAINPIPAGGIVSVPNIGGGAGAAVVTSQVINAKWANAILMANASTARTAAAIALTDPSPSMAIGSIDQTYAVPTAPNIGAYSPLDIKTMYDDARKDLGAAIDTAFVGFISTYFPSPVYYTDAMDWCHNQFKNGGSGINVLVESALWERGRARLALQAARDTDDAFSLYASRGFPLPPGALLHSTKLIAQDLRDKLAEQSRDISVKSFEAELQNNIFALGKVLDQHKIALDAAGDYIRTYMLGPQTAMQLATSQVDQRAKFAQSLVSLYGAQTAALEPKVRLTIADAQLQAAGREANLRSASASQEARVQAAMGDARMVGGMAAASLNGISAGATIAGSDSGSGPNGATV